jgi:flagellar biosynthesis GTPase FlhF
MDDVNLCKTDIEQTYCSPDGLLLIPNLNLYTKQKNNELYLIKFIDGILRNHTIKISVFEHSHSTIYFTDKYNLTEDELLFLESLLLPYLEKLGKTVYSNERVTYLSFEDLQPEEILNLADIVEVEYQSPAVEIGQPKLKVTSEDDDEDEEEDEEESTTESESESELNLEDGQEQNSDEPEAQSDEEQEQSDEAQSDQEEPEAQSDQEQEQEEQSDEEEEMINEEDLSLLEKFAN